VNIAVDLNYRSQGATAQAGSPLQIVSPVVRCLPRRYLQLSAYRLAQNLAAFDMAGSTQADFYRMLSGRRESKLRIKSSNPKNLVFGDFKESGNSLNALLRKVTQLSLKFLENGD
jgi:hypothetical protein